MAKIGSSSLRGRPSKVETGHAKTKPSSNDNLSSCCPADFPSADFSDYNISPNVRGSYESHDKIGAPSRIPCAIGVPSFTDGALSRGLAAAHSEVDRSARTGERRRRDGSRAGGSFVQTVGSGRCRGKSSRRGWYRRPRSLPRLLR